MSGSLHSSGNPGSDRSCARSSSSSHERYGEDKSPALRKGASTADSSEKPGPAPPAPAEVPSLLARLAAAQQQLQHADPSELGETETLDSEERDNALLAQQIEDQLERHSSSASGRSNHNNKKDVLRRLHGSGQARRRHRRGVKSSSSVETSSQSTLSTGRLHQMVSQFAGADKHKMSAGSADDLNSQKTKEELLLALQELQVENTRLLRTKGQADTKHTADVASLQDLVDASKLRDTENYEELAFLTANIATMAAAHASEVDDLGKKLANSRGATDLAEGELDDMMDKMAGRDAVQLHKVRKLEETLQAEKADREQSDERAEENKRGRHAFWESEVKSLEKQLAKSKDDARASTAERDVLRRAANTNANDAKEVSRLQGQLDVANAEIRRRDDLGRVVGRSGWRDAQRREDRDTFKNLRDQFTESQSKEAVLTKELGEMKLQMLRQSEGHETNTRDLQGQLHAANLKLNDKSNAYHRSSGMVTPTSLGRSVAVLKGLATHTLDSIEEEDNFSQDASMAASFEVSSTGGDEVGNMQDFEDVPTKEHDLKVLRAEYAEDKKKMAEDKEEMQEMKSEMVGTEAKNASRVARLLKQLSAKKAGAQEQDEEITQLKQSLIGDGSRHTEEIAALRRLLATANTKGGLQADNIKLLEDTVAANDKQKEQDDVDYDKLIEDLYMAQAARDSAERRAEDLKLAMESREAQHKQEIERLISQMNAFYTNHTDGGGGGENAVAAAGAAAAGASRNTENSPSLAEQVEALIEEKNLLQNELEWKEVQWRNKVEDLEQQLVLQAAQLTNDMESRQAHLVQEIANLKARAEELIEERDELLMRLRSPAG